MNIQTNSENEANTTTFWQAADIVPEIDPIYLQQLHIRLGEMVWHLYHQLPILLRPASVATFISEEIADLYQALSREHILEKYRDSTGQHRHVEDVYFAWLKQRTLTRLFFPVIAYILQTPSTAFRSIEPDIFLSKDFPSQQSFLIDILDGEPLRLQLIFDGDNNHNLSQNQIKTAQDFYQKTGRSTLFLYLDLLNKQGAILPLEWFNLQESQIIPWQSKIKGPIPLSPEDFTWKFSQIPPIYQETVIPALAKRDRAIIQSSHRGKARIM